MTSLLNRFSSSKKEPSASSAKDTAVSQKTMTELVKSTQFQEQEINNLYEVFYNISDSAGLIDKQHFQERLGLMSARKTHFVDRLYDTVRSKEAKIGFHAYVMALHHMARADVDERAKFMFRLYDSDNSESLSRTKVRAMVESMADCALAVCEYIVQTSSQHLVGSKRLEADVKLLQRGSGELSRTHISYKSGGTMQFSSSSASSSSSAAASASMSATTTTSSSSASSSTVVSNVSPRSADSKPFVSDEAVTKICDAIFEAAGRAREGKISLKEFRTFIGRDPQTLDILTFYAKMLATLLQNDLFDLR